MEKRIISVHKLEFRSFKFFLCFFFTILEIAKNVRMLSYMSKNMLLSEKNGLNFNSMILTHCVMLDVEMLLNLLELEAMAECEDLHD